MLERCGSVGGFAAGYLFKGLSFVEKQPIEVDVGAEVSFSL